MNNITRVLLFVFLCIPSRLLLAYLPQVLPKQYLVYYGILILSMSIGFLYLAVNNSRLNAPEGGGKTWWASYRFIHGMLLLTAFIYLIKSDKNASIPLLIDAIFGIALFFIMRVGIFN